MSFVSNKWKTLSKKSLVNNAFVNLWEEEVERPDGKTSLYYVFRREPFSIVIPFEDNVIYMVRQYRYTVASLSLEFPMGIAVGKSPKETAEIELKEEVGASANKLTEIGKHWAFSGKADQYAYVYVAEDLDFGEQQLEDGEFIQVEKHSVEDVRKMIRSGEILDGQSITAFYFFEQYLQQL